MKPINKLDSRMAAFFAALVMALSFLVVNVSPAYAYGGGTVYHVNPDDGFDDPWAIYCATGTVHYLYEGEYSKYKSRCADVDQISVTAGHKLVCDDQAVGLNRRTYYPGVHNISNTADLRCWHQLT